MLFNSFSLLWLSGIWEWALRSSQVQAGTTLEAGKVGAILVPVNSTVWKDAGQGLLQSLKRDGRKFPRKHHPDGPPPCTCP